LEDRALYLHPNGEVGILKENLHQVSKSLVALEKGSVSFNHEICMFSKILKININFSLVFLVVYQVVQLKMGYKKNKYKIFIEHENKI